MTFDKNFVFHLVPDGPEPNLAIPGPLGVSLRLHSMYPNSRILTSSINHTGLDADSRISEAEIEIYPKLQYKSKLVTGLSIKLVKSFIFLPRQSLVHIHLSRSITTAILSLASLIRSDLTIIVQTHGSVKSSRHLGKKFFDFCFTRILMIKATYLIALQENEAFHIEKIGGDKAKIVIIPNSIAPLSAYELLAIDEYNSEKITVLFVGHLRPAKQVMTFLEVAKIEKYHYLDFKIAGPDGGDLRKLKEELSKLRQRNVEYLGSLTWPELSKAYITSDIILSPALDAPFDLSFLDGVARGCIGVASREFNNWEILQNAGVLIAKDTSVQELGDQLDLAINLLKQWSFNRRLISESVINSFGASRVIEKWIQIYNSELINS